MTKTILTIALITTGSFAACAVPIGRLKTRASFDFNCPQEKLTLVELDSHGITQGVTGCNHKATYIWVCGQKQSCMWVMNTNVQKQDNHNHGFEGSIKTSEE
jgi:hypothetical protein